MNDNLQGSVRIISDVPKEKLDDVVKDLQYEVGKDNIRVTLQSDNLWRIEYSQDQASSPPTGSGRAFAR
jgi:hemolysin activation/secretion protein